MRSREALVALFAAITVAPTAAAQGQRSSTAVPPAANMPAMHCGGEMPMMARMGAGRAAMPGMRGDSMRHMMGMMEGMSGPPAPAAILMHKRELELSANQVARLEDLQKRAEPECSRHMNLAMAIHMAANQLLERPAPDFAAYSAKLREGMSHMVEGHLVMAKAGVAARDILTAKQRETLKRLMAEMHKR